MKKIQIIIGVIIVSFTVQSFQKNHLKIFNGKTFSNWEGDTLKTWKIRDNALWGGSLEEVVPLNNFLCTKKSYGDFRLKLKFKLENKGGFCNAGVQFRSIRSKNPTHEMIGYQADLGPNYWGALYDESRRDKVLMAPDSNLIKKILKVNDWNDYEVIAVKNRIQIKINNTKTVDYTELDSSIPQTGIIGLQVHGGGKTRVGYKEIYISEIK
ncbi:MAG: hypothetical protein RLZZ306_519 [Bacteroidota bacterium]